MAQHFQNERSLTHASGAAELSAVGPLLRILIRRPPPSSTSKCSTLLGANQPDDAPLYGIPAKVNSCEIQMSIVGQWVFARRPAIALDVYVDYSPRKSQPSFVVNDYCIAFLEYMAPRGNTGSCLTIQRMVVDPKGGVCSAQLARSRERINL